MRNTQTKEMMAQFWRDKAALANRDKLTDKVSEYIANADALGVDNNKGKMGSIDPNLIIIEYPLMQDYKELADKVKIMEDRITLLDGGK